MKKEGLSVILLLTKITAAQGICADGILKESKNEEKNRKIEYLCNFRHKYSYVYIILNKYSKDLLYTKDNIMSYLDMAMAKPQQGSFISSDNKALLNTNFIDLRLDVGFESAFDTGIESVDWISHPDLKQIFKKLDWFNNEQFVQDVNIDMSNISNINERDINGSINIMCEGIKKYMKKVVELQVV